VKLKNHKIFLPLLCTLFVCDVKTEVREHIETPCTMQAPEKIVGIVSRVALLTNFEGQYEVAVPKKAGLQVNPWYKFVAHGINPQTNNPIVIVNPKWFLSIPEKQQNFLLGRCFLTFKHGMVPLSIRIIPYLFGFFSILFIIFLVWGLGKTRFGNQKMWIRILIAFGILVLFERALTDKLQTKVMWYFGSRYEMQINEMALQKSSDRNSAIKALEFFDASIKDELKKNEVFWAPYASLFQGYANKLKE